MAACWARQSWKRLQRKRATGSQKFPPASGATDGRADQYHARPALPSITRARCWRRPVESSGYVRYLLPRRLSAGSLPHDHAAASAPAARLPHHPAFGPRRYRQPCCLTAGEPFRAPGHPPSGPPSTGRLRPESAGYARVVPGERWARVARGATPHWRHAPAPKCCQRWQRCQRSGRSSRDGVYP